MSNLNELLLGFQHLVSEFIEEEQQKSPPSPPHGPAQSINLKLQRLAFGFRFYLKPRLGELIQWSQKSRETSNFTYDLTDLNLSQLAGWISAISNSSLAQSNEWIHELRNDNSLRDHLNHFILNSEGAITADTNMGYGRRLGWYALIRALKPRIVVETGVDKGLGSCVIASALLRNQAEGFPGRYIGTDINPNAGWLFQGPYRDVGDILFGDSIQSLETLDAPVDLFINDSDHSAEYEEREYSCISSKLAPGAVVLGDNAHVTDKLYQFALTTGRSFLFFSEKPSDHWYPGAGIGAAWGSPHAPLLDASSSPTIF